MNKFIVYCRVSTADRGEPGIDLEGQQSAVVAYISSFPGGFLTKEYVEVESSRKNRPAFTAALTEAKAWGATLLIAKLGRLTRNHSFLKKLKVAHVNFACCDNPYVTPSTIDLLADMAGHEALINSARTKKVLRTKRIRGEAEGSPEKLTDETRAASLAVRQAAAKDAASQVSGIIADRRSSGWTYQQITDYLNDQKFTTSRGGQWSPTAIQRIAKIDIILGMLENEGE